MKTDNLQILESLETVAAAFPWDTVQIEVARKPEGEYRFVVWLTGNDKLGLPYECASGNTPEEAAAYAIQRYQGTRDPEAKRNAKIAELREQIAKLEAVVLGIPPYRPNRQLAQINLPAVKEDIVV